MDTEAATDSDITETLTEDATEMVTAATDSDTTEKLREDATEMVTEAGTERDIVETNTAQTVKIDFFWYFSPLVMLEGGLFTAPNLVEY